MGLNFLLLKRVGGLKSEISEILRQTAQAKESQKSIAARQEQYAKYASFFASLDSMYVDANIPRDFVNYLQDAAKNNDVTIKITSSELRQEEGMVKFGLQISGTYSNCFHYLTVLEKSPWFLEITEIKGSSKDAKTIEMYLMLNAQIKK